VSFGRKFNFFVKLTILSHFYFSNDIQNIFADNQEVQKRRDYWAGLFDKYSKAGDGEEDGIDLDDLIAEEEAKEAEEEEEISSYPEALEDSDSKEDNDRQLVPVASGFGKLSAADQLQKLSHQVSPELIAQLQEAYQQRSNELERLKLPFWNMKSER
jgi:hypothetical protein